MGHRLTKLYTRTGDAGETGLANGSRVAKDDPRIQAIGAVDELNSHLGLLRCEDLPTEVQSYLEVIQHELFDLGGDLAAPGRQRITPDLVTRLEQEIDHLNDTLSPLKEFILPGGSRAAAICHIARTVCRRAEQNLVSLHRESPQDSAILAYLNRISDLLFAAARHLNRHAGGDDVYWKSDRIKAGSRSQGER